ncbi:hypothetical protein [Streptomyces sp. NRRL S-146]|uniref:hypothetical protein n=1 Tax=Streptomyces sp. NRRL S-146 TaxID=1463884 RepID=UPI0004CB9C02|nr:hypothetical protein [Streptomyces sp. NRRL S-146]
MDRDHFPSDLLKDQSAWYVTYDELATDPAGTQTAARRRRLLELSRLVAGHPFWKTSAGTPAARMALKEIARAQTRAGS